MIKKLMKTKNEWASGIKNYQLRREVLKRDAGVLEMCRKCFAFKYENNWHFERPTYLEKSDAEEKITVRLSQCPACIEEALSMYDMEYV